jgi:hypothetical protein
MKSHDERITPQRDAQAKEAERLLRLARGVGKKLQKK